MGLENFYMRSMNIKTKVLSKLRSKYLRYKGLKGVLDLADIRPTSELDKVLPISLEEIWDEQDKYYNEI